MSSIYSILMKDHEKVEKLFEEIEKIRKEYNAKKHSSKVESIFNDIKKSLEIHTKAEEKEFYNLLENHKNAHTLILEAKEEHYIVDKIMKELDSGSKFDEKWFAKLHELKELVFHHVKEEETKIFAIAEKIFSKQDEKNIAENFLKSKEKS